MIVQNANIWGRGIGGFSVANGQFAQVGGDIRGEDWSGRFVLPGFIDAHCHILPSGLDLLKLDLTPCESAADVLNAISDWLPRVPPGSWLHAVQYDQNKYGRHLTRHEIDRVARDVPVLLRHSNGHASVANTLALRDAKVEHETPDPTGGEYVRDEAGELTGVLLERAHEIVTSAAPEPTLEEMVEGILRAADSMANFGITSATDMMTGRWNLEKELTAYRLASERGSKIRIRLFLQWREVLGDRAMNPERLAEHRDAMDEARCRILGLKVFADGAIGSATAATHQPYRTTGKTGKLIYAPEKLAQIIAAIDDAGFACSVHTIGDRSTDLVMEAYEKTRDPARHRIEHAMILSDAQIERMAALSSHLAMQPEFLFRFGHAYRAQLADDVWPRLNRVKSCLEAGIPMSFNSDRPIVKGDPWTGIKAAAHRPAGFDPREAVEESIGIDLYTRGGALANQDGGSVGEIMTDQWADFQVREGSWDGPLVAVYRAGERVI